MSKFSVRVIRTVTQFVDLIVTASTPDCAESTAITMAKSGDVDHLFQENERPYENWDLHVNDDVEQVGDEVEETLAKRDPSVVDRSQRIEALAKMYEKLTGDEIEEGRKVFIASMMADIRHWCDLSQVDFHGACDLSYQHYLDERAQETQRQKVVAIAIPGGLKSISDDDLCATCAHCQYQPGEQSGCTRNWPGQQDADGYISSCHEHSARTE